LGARVVAVRGVDAVIVVMKSGVEREQVRAVIARLEALGFAAHLSEGKERTVIGAIGDRSVLEAASLEAMPGVERLVPIRQPFKLASREFQRESTVVSVGGVLVGGEAVAVIAGPCAVESREQLMATAAAVKAAGAHMLRGGAFKPRSSPYTFQGMEEEGLRILAEARERFGLPIVTEVMSPDAVELVAEYADCLQIGTRNMQNFQLLREAGRSRRPVLLKRGMAATIQEWLMAAEYVLSEGNRQVILCERGIRTFETATRNTLDLNAVPVAKELSHLPVIVDPSHGTGRAALVPPLTRAAVAAGADGLILEVHPNPAEALSDGVQSLLPADFERLMEDVRRVAEAVGRRVEPVSPAPMRVRVEAD
jgi:3-deoxy-7-phosphoheptulonate synthase